MMPWIRSLGSRECHRNLQNWHSHVQRVRKRERERNKEREREKEEEGDNE
jgi:hypothetical protein